MPKFNCYFLFIALFIFTGSAYSQTSKFLVVAYYSAGPEQIDSFPIEKLTHVIFSFSHLKGNQLHVNNARDSATIKKLVGLKSRNPQLKVLLSLGGWGGCGPCSEVFSSKKNRTAFAKSVYRISNYFGADGIDLDWEYPAIAGFPGHVYQAADKENFTSLVTELRKETKKNFEITFAAGGFRKYIDESIDWDKVMKKINFVNLMTYDLVNGFDTITGNHTPLYSNPPRAESTDNAVSQLIGLGVPANKIVIGAAFYGRIWENVADTNFGMHQQGKFKTNVDFKNMISFLAANSGFVYHWDSVAQAPFMYNPIQKHFLTFDDKRSIALKTKYAMEKGLGGIMFWELSLDAYKDGLLDVIDNAKNHSNKIE